MSGFFTDTHKDYPDPPQPEIIRYPGKIKSVSFSTLDKFEKCPHALYLSKVQGIGNKGSVATDRGSYLHDMLEQYVLGNIPEVTWSKLKSGEFHKPLIDSFRTDYLTHQQCEPELKLAFTLDMKPTTWDASDMWLRGAIDVVSWMNKQTHATIYDYKSGQDSMAAKHRAQLLLYACMMFLAYPDLQTIDSTAIYLDLKKENFYTNFKRADLTMFWPRYYDRLRRVTEATDFQPNPNGFTCRWCQHKIAHAEFNQTEPACKFAYIK